MGYTGAREEIVTPSLLFVVAQDEPGIYQNLTVRFGGVATVRIVLDRRRGERRRGWRSQGQERRMSERRQYPVDDRLQSLGYAVLVLP